MSAIGSRIMLQDNTKHRDDMGCRCRWCLNATFLSRLVSTDEFTDFTIVCGGHERKRQVHRLILSAASTYFAHLFRVPNVRETILGRIEFPETDPELVFAMVDWMYYGKIEVSAYGGVSGYSELLLECVYMYAMGEQYGVLGLPESAAWAVCAILHHQRYYLLEQVDDMVEMVDLVNATTVPNSPLRRQVWDSLLDNGYAKDIGKYALKALLDVGAG
ncbi:Kelch-like protein 5 [Diplodia intermedia]|uniref:Kelch-like protein 5 n=1 Tax=Diplodia intermedia TaxID=856260 RepID=A0ABR3THS4_9PEZI